tara:strand:- start:648 stop:923 length:276 start_codon:yes stop_codon:yes gene_type:complete
LSNNHKKHNYFSIIVDDMGIYASEVFSKKIRLLSINIDLEQVDDGFVENISDIKVKTCVEKKSKDVLFLKTTLLENKNIIVTASAVWSKEP